jgi:hypothetical protein
MLAIRKVNAYACGNASCRFRPASVRRFHESDEREARVDQSA